MSNLTDITSSNVYWQGQTGHAKREAAYAQEEAHRARMEALELEKKAQQAAGLAQANEAQAEDLAYVGAYLAKRLEEVKAENQFYKDLLSKPMSEIAAANSNFKATYDKQQELLASWMVSQRAFKEVAIDLGIEVGKTKEDVIALAQEAKEAVIDNNTKHGNDLDTLKIDGKPIILNKRK